MHFRNYCILEMRDVPLAPIQPADNQQVTETSSTSPVRSNPGCSQAGFSSTAKSTEPVGAHPFVSPNSSSLPLAIFAAVILEEKENTVWLGGTGRAVGSWWDLVFFEEGFKMGVEEHWTGWPKRWWVTITENIQGRGWTGLSAPCSSWRCHSLSQVT